MHFPMFIFLFSCRNSIWDICAKKGSKNPLPISGEEVNMNKRIHLKISFQFHIRLTVTIALSSLQLEVSILPTQNSKWEKNDK